MSMAKSALSVQVTFDPEVEAVFRTLNRMVYQSAGKRLLATLCYAVIDPARRTLAFASAGHLFPYRLSSDGSVEALESISYPLGVRPSLHVHVQEAQLESGDVLFLFSDGVVEAHADQSDEVFGFERLESSLARYAGHDVDEICEGVLAELACYTQGGPRADDLTLLVLAIP
jgi:sigma-B regulation protein RsbU (phosphoserine phosphatase)